MFRLGGFVFNGNEVHARKAQAATETVAQGVA